MIIIVHNIYYSYYILSYIYFLFLKTDRVTNNLIVLSINREIKKSKKLNDKNVQLDNLGIKIYAVILGDFHYIYILKLTH